MASCSMLMMFGCATGTSPYSPFGKSSLKGDKVIYFEQTDRIPKVVAQAPWDHAANAKAGDARAVDYGAVVDMLDKLFMMYPNVVEFYGQERMENALIGRRMLFRGYSNEELKDVEKIARALGDSIENWTPQQ